jgi:hypothetical protein
MIRSAFCTVSGDDVGRHLFSPKCDFGSLYRGAAIAVCAARDTPALSKEAMIFLECKERDPNRDEDNGESRDGLRKGPVFRSSVNQR